MCRCKVTPGDVLVITDYANKKGYFFYMLISLGLKVYDFDGDIWMPTVNRKKTWCINCDCKRAEQNVKY